MNNQHIFILCLCVLFFSCGSAVEFSSVDSHSAFSNESAEGDSQTLAVFQGMIDPFSNEIFLTPVTNAADLVQLLLYSPDEAQYLSANLSVGAGEIALSDWTTSYYNFDANEIDAFSLSGPTIQNTHASMNYFSLTANFSAFNPSGVTMSNGAFSSGNSYVVNYGDVTNGNIASRGFTLSAPSGTTFTFALTFDAFVSPLTPSVVINAIEPIEWPRDPAEFGQYRILGTGFNPVTEVLVGTTAQTGADLPNPGPTEVTLSSIVASSGILSLEIGVVAHLGPYVITRTKLKGDFGRQVGSDATHNIFFYTWEGAAIPGSDPGNADGNCPPTSLSNPGLINGPSVQTQEVTLNSTTTQSVTIRNLQDFIPGPGKSVVAIWDMNDNDTPDNGDQFVYFDHNVTISNNILNSLPSTGTFSSSNTITATCNTSGGI